MTTRTSFRPRPLDQHKQLEIVRDPEAQLETAPDLQAARQIANNHEGLDKANEEAKMVANANAKGGQEIPVPLVLPVPTYTLDYLPTFREKPVYIRGRGGVGYRDDSLVEYDMDSEDEAWLENINDGQDRLPPARFELMIWKLEVTNAQATDRTFSAAGAAAAERNSASAVSSTDHMTKEEALEALAAAAPAREMMHRRVLDYWLRKRKKHGKPLLRSLQAPTSVSDTNPFNVFRPRERIHRPQTRRRRENNEEAMEKMRLIQTNMIKARELVEAVLRRERKKRDIVYAEVDAQQLQIKLRHEPRAAADSIEAEYAAAARAKAGRRPLGFEVKSGVPGGGVVSADLPVANGVAPASQPSDASRKSKKRKRDARNPQRDAIAQLPPAPLEVTDALLAVHTPDVRKLCMALGEKVLRLPQALMAALNARRGRPRAGRGSRLLFDRCNPVTYELYEVEDKAAVSGTANGEAQPLHQLPNPYGDAKMPQQTPQQQQQQQQQPQLQKPSQPAVAPSAPAAAPAPAPAEAVAAPASAPEQPLAVQPQPTASEASQPAVTPKASKAPPATPQTLRTGSRKAARADTRATQSAQPKRGPGRPPKSGQKGGSPMDTS